MKTPSDTGTPPPARRYDGMAVWLDDLRRDVAYAARMLRRSPGFTVVAVITLAIGIGVNGVVFTVTNAALFKGFPLVAGNDRLVYMTSMRGCCVSYPDFEDWRAQASSFSSMALVHGMPVTFSDGRGIAERYDATEITADTFTLVGQRPVLGRDFTAADEAPGAAPVAILRHAFWQGRLGGDPRVIGRTVRLDGLPRTVVGVMPAGFSFPQNQDFWLPLVQTPEVRRRDARTTWFVVARLQNDATLDGARAEMATIGRRLAAAYPLTNQGPSLVPIVETFEGFFIGATAGTVYRAMWAAVGLVLLIACANLANLLLGRAMTRSREMTVRMALGAGQSRIVRQLLIESLLLACLGGLAAWWIAGWGLQLYVLVANGPGISTEISGTWFNDILDYSMDGRVLAYLAAIAIGTGVLFGLAPALRLARLDVDATLRNGSRGVSARSHHLPNLLVAGQMALAVVLVAGAGLMVRSFVNAYGGNPGFDPTNVLVALVSLPGERYPAAADQSAFFDRLTRRVSTAPGVRALALASSPPGATPAAQPFELAAAPAPDTRALDSVRTVTVTDGYFDVLGEPLITGRSFGTQDRAGGLPVAIVNQRFVDRYWPDRTALGQRLRLFSGTTPGAWLTVIGVAPDVDQSSGPARDLEPAVYLTYRQRIRPEMWMMVRTNVAGQSATSAIRQGVQALDPDLPIADGPAALTERLARANQYRAVITGLFVIVAAIALLLASVGLYAVIAQAVSQRTREFGVRAAMGATTHDILGLVLQRGLLLAGSGLAVGLAGSLAVNRVIRDELVRVSPTDPTTLLFAAIVLMTTAALGCVIPARRAVQIDPASALKPE